MTLLIGLRTHEIVSITARDIDHEGKLLWIPESKTEAGRKNLEIPGLLQPLLERLRRKKQPHELLLGEHWRDWPRKWVQQICTLAEVPVVTAHGMRGLHSTLALQAGASPQVVAASLGHQSYQTKLQHYAAPGFYEAHNKRGS